MESVGFQSDMLYKQLTGAFGKLGKDSTTNDFIDASLEIGKMVQHVTGMSIRLTFDEIGNGAYMIIPELTAQHALMASSDFSLSNTDGLSMIRKAKTAIKGSVDTKRNTVDGVFKDITLSIHMPMKDFKSNFLTAEESAGVFLHELGHGFIYFLYLSRTCTTNQILAGLTKGLDGSDTYGNKQILLTEVAKSVGLSGVDVNTLAATTDKRVIHVVVVTALQQEYAKETGYDIYDRTANEALADQYATRMGAGRALVTGLDKSYRKYDNMSYRTTHAYLLLEAAKVSILLLSPFFAVTVPGFTNLSAWMAIVGLTMIAADATEFGMAGRYDMPGDRFGRVRAQLVEKIKNRDLSQDEVKAVTSDIDAIDSLMAAINDRRQLFGVVQDFLTSRRRYGRDMKLLQQSLEKLAANDLFVAAARINATAQA